MNIAITDKVERERAAEIVEIINTAYLVPESEIWGMDIVRTYTSEVEALLEKEELLVAFNGEDILGCIRTYPMDADNFGFGLLAVKDDAKGKGVAKKLIQAAEQKAIHHNAQYMQLDVLVLVDEISDYKVFLIDYYKKLGYIAYREKSVNELPESVQPKFEKTLGPSVFKVYRKPLK